MAHNPRALHIRQGTTYRVTFTWTTGTATPTPVSLSGYTVTFRLLRRAGTLPPLLTLSSTGSQVVVEPGGAVGKVAVTLTAEQTGALSRDCVYILTANPSGQTEPQEYVASGPVDLIKMGE